MLSTTAGPGDQLASSLGRRSVRRLPVASPDRAPALTALRRGAQRQPDQFGAHARPCSPEPERGSAAKRRRHGARRPAHPPRPPTRRLGPSHRPLKALAQGSPHRDGHLRRWRAPPGRGHPRCDRRHRRARPSALPPGAHVDGRSAAPHEDRPVRGGSARPRVYCLGWLFPQGRQARSVWRGDGAGGRVGVRPAWAGSRVQAGRGRDTWGGRSGPSLTAGAAGCAG